MNYRRLCELKKEEWNKELLKEAREVETQEQIWKIVNKVRKKSGNKQGNKNGRVGRSGIFQEDIKKIGKQSKAGTGKLRKRERGKKGRGRERGGDGKSDKIAAEKKSGRGGRTTK